MTPSAPPPPPAPQPPPATPAAGSSTLREMRWWDIDAVLELERDLFPQDAWSRGMFWSELAHARGHGASRHYVVAEAGGRLLGYGGLAVSADLADVQTIAVVREQWGTGLGARLLTDLLRYATAAECAEVMLEVRVDNTRAQRLYERFGFEPVGFRRGYYQPGNVDALVMRLIPGAPDDAGPAQPVPGPEQPAVPRPATSREGSRGPAGATDSSAASFPVTHAATPEAGTAAAEERPGHEQPQREKPPQELRVPEHHGPEQQGPETHG